MDTDADKQDLTVVPYNARCGIYDSSTGFYYDNVRIDLRGNTSGTFAKKSHGLRFNKSQPISCTDPVTGTVLKEIRKSSFTAEYADPSFLRQHLAFKIFRENGSPTPFHYPVRLNRNGEFYQLAFHTERFTDELIEDCYGYDPLGYAYKNVGNFNDTSTNAGSIEKKTPDDENEKDLAQLTTFINQIKAAANVSTDTDFATTPTYSADLTKVVVEKFDLPAWINYLALARITHENDDVWANLSAYYDINGQGTWKPLAYDMNLSFGQYYNDVSSMSGSGITADDDAFKSHPFYGGYHVRVEALKGDASRCCRAVEAVWQSEKFRRLYLRRLRTLMDEILKEPGTAKEATPFWQYASSITNKIVADAVLDRAKTPIGSSCNKIWNWGSSAYTTMTVADGMEDIWNNYVEKRRIHLYDTHSATNSAKAIGYGSAFNAGIPLSQSPIETLAAGFSIENAAEDGSFTATDKIVIKNANAEAVDMSRWKMTGAVTYTFPAGSVVDANGTITVVADRKAYVAANTDTLTDEVLLGNAVFAGEGKVNLFAADETTVIQGDPVEATGYDGEYNEEVVINRSGEYVFSNAVFNAGIKFGDGNYIVKRQKGYTSTATAITCAGNITFTGKGELDLTGPMTVNNLIVSNGTFAVSGSAELDTTNTLVTVNGNFLVDGGAVTIATSGEGTVYGIFLASKNMTAEIRSGSFAAEVRGAKSSALRVNKGSSATAITGGELTAKLYGESSRFIDVDGTLAVTGSPSIRITDDSAVESSGISLFAAADPAANLRAIKAGKAVTIEGGSISVSVPGTGSEAISSDSTIAISGGTVDLLAGDDCLSAQGNIDISGGKVYANSTRNDAIDANGNITINGGLVLAYTTAIEADGNGSYGLDVNNTEEAPHTITVNGGTLVALSGPGATYAQPAGTQTVICANNIGTVSEFSNKYITLTGTVESVTYATTIGLPAIDKAFSMLLSVPGLAQDAGLAFYDTAPETGAINFHNVYRNEVVPPAEPEGPVAEDPNVVWNSDGGMFVYENFGRAVKFTVNYETTEPLTDFPVLVKLAEDSPADFTYADFYNDAGADLVFVDDAGKVIPHEIDTWNRNGTSLVWVKVPVVTNGATFAMCYRSAKDGSKLATDGVWNDYTGVWHLGETGNGVQTVLDSTTNDLDMVSHANSLAEVSGPVGAARRISTKTGASDANGRVFLDLSQDAVKKAKVDDLGTSFVASFWAKLSGNSDWAYLIGRKANDNDLSWAMQFNSATDQKSIRIFTSANNQSQNTPVNEFANLKTAWIKVDLVYNNNNFIIYCNGASASQGNTLNNTTAKQQGDFAFGGCAGSGYGSFNGWMDEVRLRKGVPSAAWVAADYATQGTDTFLAAAPVVEIAEKPIPVVDLQLVDSGARYVQFSAKAGNFGGAAESCAVEYKLWADGDAEPDNYTVLIDSLVLNETAGKLVTGLLPEIKYCYKLRANNSLAGGTSEDVCGEFTTGGTGDPGVGGDRYRVQNDYVHKYIIGTEDMTFTPPSYATKFTALLVGGGGAGGYRHGGGGGAGGLVYTEVDVSPGETFTVSVGAGGVASSDISVLGSNGGDSTLSKNGEVIHRAVGGGAGGNCYVNPANNKESGVDWSLTQGRDGGSGGGNGYFNYDSSLGDDNYATRYNKHRGQGTANQGFNGGAANVGIKSITQANNNSGSVSGGGGGGAGKAGGDASEDHPASAGSGGSGKTYDISGRSVYYAGGGAGGTQKIAGDKNANINTFALGGAGGGGNGGWWTTMATPGVDGLGGGGGGGSGDTGYYQGANGGSGCVYIRYCLHGNGAGSAKPVCSLTAAALVDGLMKVKIDYRAAWAGEGYELCDVYAAYGTTPNALTGEALIAQDTIGTGSGEFSLNAPDTVFYIRLRLKNAAGEVSDSDDIYEIRTGSLGETPSTVLTLASTSVAGGDLSATINSTAAGTVWRLTGAEYGGNSLEGWTKASLGPIEANGSLEDTVAIHDVNFVRYALAKSDGSYEFTETIVLAKLDVPALGEPTATANAISATVTGEVTSFGLSEQGTLRLYVSTVNDIATCKLKKEIDNQSIGSYTIELDGLERSTTYYYYVEALSENGGAAKSELKSFSTFDVSLASRQATVDQRNVTFSAKFGQVPSDIGVVFKLMISFDGGPSEEVVVASSVTAGQTYSYTATAAAFGVKVEAEYIAVCTAGDKVWTLSLAKNVAATTEDKATYTWVANTDGELSGNWNDPAHWHCDKEQRSSDLPGAIHTVYFAPNVTEAYTVTLTNDTIVGTIDFTGNTARNISIAGNGKRLTYTSLASLNNQRTSGLKLTFDNVVLTGTNQHWPNIQNKDVAAELRFINNSSAQFADFYVQGNSSRVEVASGSTLTVNKLALAGNGTVATIDNATIIAKQNIVLPDNVDNSSLTIELKGANPLLKGEGPGFQWFGGYNLNSDSPVVFRCFVPAGGWTSAPVQDDSTSTNNNYGVCLFAKPYENRAVQTKFLFEVAPESPIVGSGAELTIPIVTTANGIYTNSVEELAAIDDTEHALSGGFAYSEAMNAGGDYPLNLVLNLKADTLALFEPSATVAEDLAAAIALIRSDYYNKYTDGETIAAPDASYVKVGTLASGVTGTVSIGGTETDAGEKFLLSIGNNAFLESYKFKIVDSEVYVAAVILAIEEVKVTANATDYPIESASSGQLELESFTAVAPTTIEGAGTDFAVVRGDDKPLVKFFFTDKVTEYFVTKKTFTGKDNVTTVKYGFTTPDEGGLWLYLGYGVELGGNWDGATYDYAVYAFGVDKKAITLSMSVTDKALVPTTDDGTVAVTGEGENAVAVITPNAGVTSVTVSVPDSYTGKIQVPASVDTVSGVTLAQLVVVAKAQYGETTVDISAAFKATLAENGSITIALDPAASVQVGDETIAVRPLIVEAVDASIANGAVAAKTIPGLYYKLVRWSSLAADKTETTVVDRTLATDKKLTLTDPDKPANSAFYIIRVEK